MSWRLNKGKTCTVHLQAKAPLKHSKKPKICPTRNYVTVYFCLPEKLAKKLKNLAKEQRKSESEILRKIIDRYLKKIKGKKLKFAPFFKKFSPIGMKVLPRTIRKEQNVRIKRIAEKTGRTISEIVREAVENF